MVLDIEWNLHVDINMLPDTDERGYPIIDVCVKALRKTKPDFEHDFDHFDISCNDGELIIFIYLKNGKFFCANELWAWLLTEKEWKALEESQKLFPLELTPDRLLKMQKEIIDRIWEIYNRWYRHPVKITL